MPKSVRRQTTLPPDLDSKFESVMAKKNLKEGEAVREAVELFVDSCSSDDIPLREQIERQIPIAEAETRRLEDALENSPGIQSLKRFLPEYEIEVSFTCDQILALFPSCLDLLDKEHPSLDESKIIGVILPFKETQSKSPAFLPFLRSSGALDSTIKDLVGNNLSSEDDEWSIIQGFFDSGGVEVLRRNLHSVSGVIGKAFNDFIAQNKESFKSYIEEHKSKELDYFAKKIKEKGISL